MNIDYIKVCFPHKSQIFSQLYLPELSSSLYAVAKNCDTLVFNVRTFRWLGLLVLPWSICLSVHTLIFVKDFWAWVCLIDLIFGTKHNQGELYCISSFKVGHMSLPVCRSRGIRVLWTHFLHVFEIIQGWGCSLI